MKLAKLKTILCSYHGSIQFAVLYAQATNETLVDGATIDYIVENYPNAEVKRIQACADKLIITI